MLIDEKKLKHWIDHFYGYGSWQARIWFIGHEETGGEMPEEVAEKINYFYEANPPHNSTEILCDLRDVYKRITFRSDGSKADVFANRYEYRFGKNAILHGVWKNLIAFANGYSNKEIRDLLDYQKLDFTTGSNPLEALMSLYPLPGPQSHAWYYSWLDLTELTYLKTRTLYEERVYENRIARILANIKAYRPEVVLMYGMNNVNTLKKSIHEFFGAPFKMIKATKQQIPQHHRADINGTTILITTQIPALRHKRIETGFDWEAFGNRVKRERAGDEGTSET
jgi:hypothetical protein